MGKNEGIKEKVISLLMEKYEKEPKKVKKFSQGIYYLLEHIKRRRISSVSPSFISSEPQIEEAFRELKEYLNGKKIPRKELLLYFARIAGMERRNDDFYKALDRFLKEIYPKGLPDKKVRRTLNKQSREDMVVSLKKGINLGITRGGNPVWIEIDPQEIREREQLLSMIGVLEDPEPDVSIKHDKILYGK